MANVINLGTYPTTEGVNMEDKSIYIGNNKFVRILSQKDPHRIIAVYSESTDVFSGTQTLTNVHEQVLITGDYMTNFKLLELPSGNLVLVGDMSSGYSQLNTIIVFNYDAVGGVFNIVQQHSIAFGDATNLVHFGQYSVIPYSTDTLLVAGQYNGQFHLCRINSIETASITIIDPIVSNSQTDLYDNEHSMFSTVIDDYWFFSVSSHYRYNGFVINLTNNAIIQSGVYYTLCTAKLDTNRYLTISQDGSGRITYKISSNYPNGTDLQAGNTYVAPLIDHGATTNVDRIRDIIVLDRQHIMYFYRPENSATIYARIIKIIDTNYGFVSDNSKNLDGISVCSITSNDSVIAGYHTGKLVHEINATQFWMQTDTNQFTFITISAS